MQTDSQKRLRKASNRAPFINCISFFLVRVESLFCWSHKEDESSIVKFCQLYAQNATRKAKRTNRITFIPIKINGIGNWP